MTIAQWNFNTHPELGDEDFTKGMFAAYYGMTSVSKTDFDNQLVYVKQNGRYGAYKNWLQYPGNMDDPWFANLPTWTGIAVLGVGVIAAIGLIWFAWGSDIKGAFSRMKGDSYSND